eukprot:gb/GECG01014762.1/.p1 GENE.gb/GECG01014762.1/~~gb/GECG01014762.1/.p1  ORF type:complete len:123 (+),score=22.53 gb/GECG01014762.1/:1-369(+)
MIKNSSQKIECPVQFALHGAVCWAGTRSYTHGISDNSYNMYSRATQNNSRSSKNSSRGTDIVEKAQNEFILDSTKKKNSSRLSSSASSQNAKRGTKRKQSGSNASSEASPLLSSFLIAAVYV